MNLHRVHRSKIRKHIFVWITLEVFLIILGQLPGSLFAQIAGVALIVLIYIVIFYLLGLYIFPRYWKKWLLLCCWLILTFGIYVFLYYWVGYYVLPIIGTESATANGSFMIFLNRCVSLYVLVLLSSSAFFLNRNGSIKIKQQNDKEKSIIIGELNFLKSQFNSHLTFNFLNFCYGRVYPQSMEAAESIELFSEMLRYSLVTATLERVSMEQEIKYLNNFIAIQKKLSSNVSVNFICNGDFNNRYIIPYIFLSIVGKVFLESHNNQPNKPIEIKLCNLDGQIILNVISNLDFTPDDIIEFQTTDEENLIQILNLYYQGLHNLQKTATTNMQTYELTLNTNHELFK